MSEEQKKATGFALSGFQNPTFEGTDVFRKVLKAMSRPGEIQDMKATCGTPLSLNASCAAILLALADMETNIWLSPEVDSPQAREFLSFHTGCRIVENAQLSNFAVLNSETDLGILKNIPLGTQEYPDRSATLIIVVEDMKEGNGLTLSGPGIEEKNYIDFSGISNEFWNWFENNSKKFPLGIDAIFASNDQVAAVPRTTSVEFKSCM